MTKLSMTDGAPRPLSMRNSNPTPFESHLRFTMVFVTYLYCTAGYGIVHRVKREYISIEIRCFGDVLDSLNKHNASPKGRVIHYPYGRARPIIRCMHVHVFSDIGYGYWNNRTCINITAVY